MISIWIDGACKANGKPECISAGGLFIVDNEMRTYARTVHELNSTSQRGEIHALIEALVVCNEYRNKGESDFRIVTDSEYMYNTVTKDWLSNWERKGWITANGDPVKNKDLWSIIKILLIGLPDLSLFHIKGHCLSIGKVTGAALLATDTSGSSLRAKLYEIYETAKPSRLAEARELFLKNHEYEIPSEEALRELIVGNCVADFIATDYVTYVHSNWINKEA
jgi:ribonuclease HI